MEINGKSLDLLLREVQDRIISQQADRSEWNHGCDCVVLKQTVLINDLIKERMYLELLKLIDEKRRLLARLAELQSHKLSYDKDTSRYNDLASILRQINSAESPEQLAVAEKSLDCIR